MAGPRRMIVGVSGASGFDYAVALLAMLKAEGIETHLVVSRSAITAMAHETELTYAEMKAMADH